MKHVILVQDRPAQRWGEAFPIGNGHLGGMVFSDFTNEKIELSENTFFSGEKCKHNNQKGASDIFAKMRAAMMREDYQGALELSNLFHGERNNYGTNLPIGYIEIATNIKNETKYQRRLSLEDACIEAVAQWHDVSIKSRAFATHVHKVLIYELSVETQILNAMVTFCSKRDREYAKYEHKKIQFISKAHEKMHSDGMTGTTLYGTIAIKTDGICKSDKSGVNIQNASNIWLYVAMTTDFDDNIREKGCKKRNFEQENEKKLQEVIQESFEGILEAHRKDIYQLYHRVELELSEPQIAKMFQFGRYLLFSSSREDSVLPTHLQGVWNDNVACRIGWTCDMHLDINTQMNYWPAEVTNLSETTESLFRWIEEKLVPEGRNTARESYGLHGWVAELVSNAWGYTAPYWASELSPCPTGGVWILTQMWEHYMFSEDTLFLEKRLFPILEEAVEFFVEYIFQDKKGFFIGGPSISPENSFCINDHIYQISNGSTYEIVMIRELFDIYLKASNVLKKNSVRMDKVMEYKRKLLPYRITKNGTIAEWAHDYLPSDVQHRHTSHLLGLFPFAQITEEQIDLQQAAEAVIEEKITPLDQWEDTGWARALLALYEARLHHPEKAYRHICCMLKELLEPNGFIIHPSTRGASSFANVYELDGNTGFSSCIAEMLLQSQQDRIYLLPCIPKEWEKGHVKGLKARGNIVVEIEWSPNRKKAWLTAKEQKQRLLRFGEKQKTVVLEAGIRTCVWEEELL